MAKKLFRPVIRNSSLAYRPELDGLRALAISAVVAAHLSLFKYGPYGVDFFFVLSGFLITDVLLKLRDKKGNLRTFWVGRIARLTPILIVNVLVGSILSYFFLRSTFHISQPLSALFYVKNFFIASSSNHDVWAPTWTLAAEEQFYLVWPLIVFFLAKRGSVKSLISFALAYFLIIHFSIEIVRYLFEHTNPLGAFSDGLRDKMNQVLIRPSEILLGSVITLAKKSKPQRLVTVFASTLILSHILGTTTSTQIALLSGTVLCLFKLKSPVSKILLKALSVRALATVGILSYSIYLWHTVIYEIIFVHYGRSLSSKFITVLATLLISYLSYTYVELPLQNFIKRKSIGP